MSHAWYVTKPVCVCVLVICFYQRGCQKNRCKTRDRWWLSAYIHTMHICRGVFFSFSTYGQKLNEQVLNQRVSVHTLLKALKVEGRLSGTILRRGLHCTHESHLLSQQDRDNLRTCAWNRTPLPQDRGRQIPLHSVLEGRVTIACYSSSKQMAKLD